MDEVRAQEGIARTGARALAAYVDALPVQHLELDARRQSAGLRQQAIFGGSRPLSGRISKIDRANLAQEVVHLGDAPEVPRQPVPQDLAIRLLWCGIAVVGKMAIVAV